MVTEITPDSDLWRNKTFSCSVSTFDQKMSYFATNFEHFLTNLNTGFRCYFCYHSLRFWNSKFWPFQSKFIFILDQIMNNIRYNINETENWHDDTIFNPDTAHDVREIDKEIFKSINMTFWYYLRITVSQYMIKQKRNWKCNTW